MQCQENDQISILTVVVLDKYGNGASRVFWFLGISTNQPKGLGPNPMIS
jgi:hypothetical protein